MIDQDSLLPYNNKTMALFRAWNLRQALDAERWCQIRSPSCWNLVEILGLVPEPFWSDPTHYVIPFLTKPRRNNETPTEFFSNENIYCNQIICMSKELCGSAQIFKVVLGVGGLHCSEVAYLLLTQQPQVWFSAFPRFLPLMLLRFIDCAA